MLLLSWAGPSGLTAAVGDTLLICSDHTNVNGTYKEKSKTYYADKEDPTKDTDLGTWAWSETATCDKTGAKAKCTITNTDVTQFSYFYTTGSLTSYQSTCATEGGKWETL